MPDVVEQFYSAQQIYIPPNLPTLMKKYAKAAIRTQPKDLLVWSAAYFKALTYGIPLPVKEKLEYPPVETITGLTPGYLKILVKQMGNYPETMNTQDVIEYWTGVCLSMEALNEILDVGGFCEKINWLKFIAICAGYLETSLTGTMILLCELLTDEPVGGSAHIPVNKFVYLYKYLARLDCGPVPPKKTTSQHPKLIRNINEIEEPLSGEDISFKNESDKSTRSVISWQSILGRMGKHRTDRSVNTMEMNESFEKMKDLPTGLTWRHIADSTADSEPDSSNTWSENSKLDHSSLGLQVFDAHEDKQLGKIVTKPDEPKRKGVCDGDKLKTPKLTRTKKKINLIGGLRDKSFDSLLATVDEERKQSMKLMRQMTEQIESDSLDYIITKSDSPSISITPEIEEEEEEEEKDIDEKPKGELNVLIEVDSSMILVPTPSHFASEDDSYEDIEALEEDSLSLGDLKKKGNFSLLDVRIPDIQIPELINVNEEDIPKTFQQEPMWVNIPGIGSKVPEQQIKQVEEYMNECANKQAGAVMPRNLRHFLCPPLDPPK